MAMEMLRRTAIKSRELKWDGDEDTEVFVFAID